MAYDEELATRVRESCADRDAVTERAMFGGLAFLHHGRMAVAVSGSADGLMVRVDPEDEADLIATTAAEPMTMGERRMTGWIHVGIGSIEDADLARWIDIGFVRAASLPST